jgi:tRNA dimethylallyltransferase
VADTKQRTRNYAKRQLTWFRRDARIHWLSGFGTDRTVVNSAIEHLRPLVERA